MSYFVTGATGFIGRFLVERLLDHREGEVFVLVREGSLPRMRRLIERWDTDRVVPVVGDLGSDLLGVDPAWVAEHRGSVDHLFHLAAIYDVTADEATNEQLNVGGTRHALELGQALDVGCFHQVSSVAAAGDFHGHFDESMFDEGQPLPSPYHRTKFLSEQLVREQDAVPWRVYRPAVVVGDSQSGAMDKVDGPYYFFPAMKLMRDRLPSWVPLVGVDLGDTNVVPVDYVVTAMDHLAHLPGRDGEAFHLVNPEPQPVVDMLNLFCAAAGAPTFATPLDRTATHAGPLGLIPRRLRPLELATYLVRSGPGKAVLGQTLGRLGVPAEVLAHTRFTATFDSRRTEQALAGSGIGVPDLESYARTLWGYWEEHLDTSTARDRSAREALTGKYVVITGASSGIGQVTALKVAQAGGVPVLVARGKEKLEEVKAAIEDHGGTAYVFPCDLSDLDAIDRLCKEMTTALPSIDFVVNNAGRSIRRSLKLSHDRFHDFERTMQLNYFGAIRLVMRLVPAMREQQARAHREHLLDRGADQPAAVLGVRRVEGGARLVEQRGGLGAGRRRHHLHRHPHAPGADADDRPDQALRQVPHDQSGAGGRPGDQGDGGPAPRDQHRPRQRRRGRAHGDAQDRLPDPQHGLPRVPGLRRRARHRRHRRAGVGADHAGEGVQGRALVGQPRPG